MAVILDHKFAIKNDIEQLAVNMIENAATILADHLNVNVKLRMERMNGWGRSDAFHAGKYIHMNRRGQRDNTIKINYRNLAGRTFDEILIVLGHEFRHAVQYQHKIVDDVPNTDYSQYGRPLSPCRIRYYNMPKEKDARKYQQLYADIVRSHDDWVHEHTMSTLTPGSLFADDHDATYAAMGVNSDDIQLFKNRNGDVFWFNINDVTNRGKKRKFTKQVCKLVWAEHRDQLYAQPWVPLQRPVDMLDILS